MSASAKRTRGTCTIGSETKRTLWKLNRALVRIHFKVSILKIYLDRCLSRWELKEEADFLLSLRDSFKEHNNEEEDPIKEEEVVVDLKHKSLNKCLEDAEDLVWVLEVQAWASRFHHTAQVNLSIIHRAEVVNRDPASKNSVNVSIMTKIRAQEEKAHKL